jgi:hypothetical protein
MQIICDSNYLKLIVLLGLVGIGSNIHYLGINYALDQIGWEYGINCIFVGIIEVISYLFLRIPSFYTEFMVTLLPRRKGVLVGCGIMAFLGLLFIY